MLCSIDGQTRQLIFRVADQHNMTISRSHLTDSMTSLTSLSTISSFNQTNKKDVLLTLAKTIADERCLLDEVKKKNIRDFFVFVFFFLKFKSILLRHHLLNILNQNIVHLHQFHQ